MTCND